MLEIKGLKNVGHCIIVLPLPEEQYKQSLLCMTKMENILEKKKANGSYPCPLRQFSEA